MLEHAREEAEPKCDVSRERAGTRGKQKRNYLTGSPCLKATSLLCKPQLGVTRS